MWKRLLLFLAFLASASNALAQASNPTIIPGSPPGGIGAACMVTTFGYLTAAGQIVTCVGGVWTVSSGGGAGTVTTVGWTGGIVSIANPTTTPAFTIAGTSGGIPYFSGAATWASSGALTANLPVIGGGAGVAPAVGTRSGNTTAFVTTTGAQTSGRCVEIDASGNHIAGAAACGTGAGTVTVVGAGALTSTALVTGGGTTTLQTAEPLATMDADGNISTPGTVSSGVGGSVAGSIDLGQGTAPAVGANVFGWGAPATMTTSVRLVSPNAVPAANQVMLFPAPTANVSAWTWTTVASANTASTLVTRDGSGNFSAGTITAALTGNASTATALATARAIYGNNFDGTAALTQVIASTYGGTGNGFFKITGPTTSEKTFTVPDASSTLTVTVASGTKALDTDAIASTACDTLSTTTATGAASTDVLIITPNADITAVTGYAPVTTGGLQVFYWLTTNTINWKICNPTSSSITPGAVTLNYRIVR